MRLHELESQLKTMREEGADDFSEVIVLSHNDYSEIQSKIHSSPSIDKVELVDSYCIEGNYAYDVIIKLKTQEEN